MRTWARARRAIRCGGCAGEIPEAAVLLEIRLQKIPGALVRCVQCAKRMFGDDPPELSDASRTAQEPRRPDFVTPRELRAQFDPKLAQVGQRDG